MISRAELRDTLRLAVPVVVTHLGYMAMTAVDTILVGRLGAEPLSAVALGNGLSITPLIVAMGTLMGLDPVVAQADDVAGARRAALAAYACGLAFMCGSALAFALVPEALARIYTGDEAVVHMAALLLPIGAAFQLFDGGQTIGIGALRGAADTRVPMVVTVVAYWVLGLPLGYLAAFRWGGGPQGLWWGFVAGLGTVAISLALRFHHRVREERLALLKAS